LEKMRSKMPRKAPTAVATEMTMMDSRMVSSRAGQVTLRSSDATSPKYRKLNALRAAPVASLPGASEDLAIVPT